MKEFVDFLGDQAPYDSLDGEDLQRLAGTVEAEYFRRGSVVVERGGEPLHHLWVVRTGQVHVLEGDRQIDELLAGDTFGHVSLYSGQPPNLCVVAAEDTLIYRVADPRDLLEHPERLRFRGYGTRTPQRVAEQARDLRDRSLQPVARHARSLVTASASTLVAEVAQQISEARQSCAVITFPDGVIGIVTDADFRSRVATGRVSPEAEVGSLATAPALTIREHTPVGAAFLEMVERGVHHLVLVDGAGAPAGVVRAVDLASAEVRDPLVIRSAVRSATGIDELRSAVQLLPATAIELFDARVPPLRISALLSAVVDAVLRRLIELTSPPATVDISWIVLGSLARREILPSSDVDTALVWADPLAVDGAEQAGPKVRAGAATVLDAMEQTGFSRCADGANADTETFARSLAQWQDAATSWVHNAGQEGALLWSTMLADSRPITNGPLGTQVTEHMLAIPRSPQFRSALLEYTLSSRPPTGFVREFVVEHSGEHRGQLSLKRGGLRPVTSLARWAAMLTGDTSGDTQDRLHRAGQAGLLTGDEAETLVGAYEQIHELALEMEVEQLRAGLPVSTYVDPKQLDTLTRRYLRESFRAIAGVQGKLESQWQRRATSGDL